MNMIETAERKGLISPGVTTLVGWLLCYSCMLALYGKNWGCWVPESLAAGSENRVLFESLLLLGQHSITLAQTNTARLQFRYTPMCADRAHQRQHRHRNGVCCGCER